MTALPGALPRLCSAAAMPAWQFDTASLLIVAGSPQARGVPLAKLLRRVLVLGDGPGWSWLSSRALRQGCSPDAPSAGIAGWFCDRSLAWRPVTVTILPGDAKAGAAADGLLVILPRQPADPGGLRELIGAIAHDLNNIVAPIAGFAELAAELPVGGREPLHAYLGEISAGAARLRAIAHELGPFAMASKRAVECFTVGEWVDDLDPAVTVAWRGEPAGARSLTRVSGSLTVANAALAAAVRAGRIRGAHGAPTLVIGIVAGRRQRCQHCGSPLPQRAVEVIVPADGADRSVAMRAAVALIHAAGGHVLAHSAPNASGFLLPVAPLP